MKVIVRATADNDLDGIFQWIAKDNPGAAAGMVSRIRDRINALEIARAGHDGEFERGRLLSLPLSP